MKRILTGALLMATSFGAAFADTPDEYLDYVATDGSAYVLEARRTCAICRGAALTILTIGQ